MLRNAERDCSAYSLPAELAARLDITTQQWDRTAGTQRLWARDAGLWTGHDENRWLGWLDVVPVEIALLDTLRSVSDSVAGNAFRHAVLLGVGGASLVVEVLRECFGTVKGYPDFLVLDSTDPGQIRSLEARLDMARTLFVVASKSGNYLESELLHAYFWRRACDVVGSADAASRFVVITDPGSVLEQHARRTGYRNIFHGNPGIGGCFSALSAFGMIPAAMMGLDVARLLGTAASMLESCSMQLPAAFNPGVLLGCILAMAAHAGRDKVTLLTSPGIRALDGWLEQLLAGSTGKQGRGLIPVAGEQPVAPNVYGTDRLFVCISLADAADCRMNATVTQIRQAQHPLVHIHVSDLYELGAEFVRWEIATAVAASLLGINPFDQPDVEAGMLASRAIRAAREAGRTVPEQPPLARSGALSLYADARNVRALLTRAGIHASVYDYLKAHLDRCVAGDYMALLAWLERTDVSLHVLQALRHLLCRRYHVATCVGFGPRFLRAGGQLYKGGPNTGVFLQLTCDDEVDLQVPEHACSFGEVRSAQAQGDLTALCERGRRVLRVHLGGDIDAALQQLWRLVERICMD